MRTGGTTEKQRPESVGKKLRKSAKKPKSKVQVHREAGKVQCASAHDRWWALGERWAALVMHAHLQRLMRHASIETTLRYDMEANADRTGDLCWKAYEHQFVIRNSQREALTSN